MQNVQSIFSYFLLMLLHFMPGHTNTRSLRTVISVSNSHGWLWVKLQWDWWGGDTTGGDWLWLIADLVAAQQETWGGVIALVFPYKH